jgi:BirA family biotin operon repressor/biotin-[acetyl-CoA-carboxylase] ligase
VAPTDLSAAALDRALPGRPVRTYPALVSTEADAVAWARAGGPEGAVVVADYQVSPRGRGGWPWTVRPGRDLGFSLLLRPRFAMAREGWLYTVASCALADVVGPDAAIEWPDEVHAGGRRAAAVGVQVGAPSWAVLNVLLQEPTPPRATLLARAVDAIEARYHAPTADVLADHARRCATLGREVRARLIPLGPAGPSVTGRAVGLLKDGALLIESAEGRRVAVRPQGLGLLE